MRATQEWEQPRKGDESHTRNVPSPNMGRIETLRSPHPEETTAEANTAASDGERIERKRETGS